MTNEKNRAAGNGRTLICSSSNARAVFIDKSYHLASWVIPCLAVLALSESEAMSGGGRDYGGGGQHERSNSQTRKQRQEWTSRTDRSEGDKRTDYERERDSRASTGYGEDQYGPSPRGGGEGRYGPPSRGGGEGRSGNNYENQRRRREGGGGQDVRKMILSLKTQHDVKDCRKTRGDDTYSEKDWREHNGHAREQDTNANANANTNTGRRSKSPSSLRNSSNRQDYKTLNYDDLGFN